MGYSNEEKLYKVGERSFVRVAFFLDTPSEFLPFTSLWIQFSGLHLVNHLRYRQGEKVTFVDYLLGVGALRSSFLLVQKTIHVVEPHFTKQETQIQRGE